MKRNAIEENVGSINKCLDSAELHRGYDLHVQ